MSCQNSINNEKLGRRDSSIDTIYCDNCIYNRETKKTISIENKTSIEKIEQEFNSPLQIIQEKKTNYSEDLPQWKILKYDGMELELTDDSIITQIRIYNNKWSINNLHVGSKKQDLEKEYQRYVIKDSSSIYILNDFKGEGVLMVKYNKQKHIQELSFYNNIW